MAPGAGEPAGSPGDEMRRDFIGRGGSAGWTWRPSRAASLVLSGALLASLFSVVTTVVTTPAAHTSGSSPIVTGVTLPDTSAYHGVSPNGAWSVVAVVAGGAPQVWLGNGSSWSNIGSPTSGLYTNVAVSDSGEVYLYDEDSSGHPGFWKYTTSWPGESAIGSKPRSVS